MGRPERCHKENLDQVEWSRICKRIWRTNHVNGLCGEECKVLRFGIAHDLTGFVQLNGTR
jgi:hypothetical protein